MQSSRSTSSERFILDVITCESIDMDTNKSLVEQRRQTGAVKLQ